MCFIADYVVSAGAEGNTYTSTGVWDNWDNWEIESGPSLGLGVRSGEEVYEGEESMKSLSNQRQSLPAVVIGERGLSMKRRVCSCLGSWKVWVPGRVKQEKS